MIRKLNAIHIASGVLWIMWKTYPHFLWISLICACANILNVDNVDKLSPKIVDKSRL